MITQEAPSTPAPLAGSAPVEYAEVHRGRRLASATLAAALLAVAVVGLAYAVPGSLAKAVAATLVLAYVVAHAGAKALPSLAFSALAFAATTGSAGEFAAPFAALAAYVLAASALALPSRLVAIPSVAVALGAVLRLTVLHPAPAGDSSLPALLSGIEATAYLALLAVVVLTSARAIRSARRRQAEALDSERRAATMKNEFVSMISHELRTPLTNIGGFAMALRESWRVFDPAEVDEFIGVICSETEHLRRLVDDVLVVPRLEVDRLLIEAADFPLRPAAFRIADLVFPQGGAKTASVSISGNAVVHADPNRVEQVLRNLLENAAKHGGSQVSVEASARNEEWLVVVADDGPGVDEEHQERVFAPFEQAVPAASPGNGLGLGLTVCRVLVEAMGGRIWYEPGFPTGTRFCFTLPAASSRQDARVAAVP
ncbi:MAG: HAMP domain-containing sensor histidine kinase [Actinomycetota bacterium]